jgi:hypothetical protein
MSFSFCIDNVDRSVYYGFAGSHCLAQGAVRFADIRSQYIATLLAKGVFARNSRNFLCCLIKRGDAPIRIDSENTLGYRIQDHISFFTSRSVLHGLLLPHKYDIHNT